MPTFELLQVCELHFHETDMEREVKIFNEETVEHLTAPLSHLRLRNGAVPSKVMACPAYLPKPETPVPERSADKKRRIELENLERTITASLETYAEYNSSRVFKSLEELKGLPLEFNSEWTVLIRSSSICFILVKEEPQRQIICSAKVSEKLCFFVHYRSVLITQVNNKLLPAKVDNINVLQNLVNECHSSFGDELGITCNANV